MFGITRLFSYTLIFVCVCLVWITANVGKFDSLLKSRYTFGLWILTACSAICNSWQKVQLLFDILLTVHLSIFILVFNQLDAQNFVLQ